MHMLNLHSVYRCLGISSREIEWYRGSGVWFIYTGARATTGAFPHTSHIVDGFESQCGKSHGVL